MLPTYDFYEHVATLVVLGRFVVSSSFVSREGKLAALLYS